MMQVSSTLKLGKGNHGLLENVTAAVSPEVLPPLPTEDARISSDTVGCDLQKHVECLWISVVLMGVIMTILFIQVQLAQLE
jgi:hypothetical protein